MDPGATTPLLDFFKRGEVDRDIRLMVARRELGLRDHEQRGLLELLVTDADPEIARLAADGLRMMTGPPGEPAEPAGPGAGEAVPEGTTLQKIAAMSPGQRLALAMKGTREERAVLVRDPNKIVAVAVLSSPKITDSEVERIAKMANVSDDVLRIIGQTRAWAKNYSIVAALTKNPKTPIPVSLTLLSRLHEAEVKTLAADRNVPDVIRTAARRRLAPR
ncbi:MAG: hypothetical protein A3F70_17685 [Acidobacteria bacterium RIFCSPLOWO2_12_FULL_67_14]|nr:MAG: hypothetical protein A3H29_07360 [Acidobacteria bacterium RIFCSPLOWO2_02_FULL_67_21]OFW35674.1 MAG: hypothetical protein A3F70_17685 [Acidobacteria bacterium RIFCSPLOWO2_12_FULL_67_14]